MNAEHFIDEEPATPAYILRVFQDWYRQAVACGSAHSSLQLTEMTSIADWREGYDLLEWRQFAAEMNKEWNIDSPMDDWRNVLEPEKSRTVGELCEFLAQRTKAPRIRPLDIAGLTCNPRASS
jgi:hypothetical protein